PQILEVGATMAPEVERRPERPRRRGRAPEDAAPVNTAGRDSSEPEPSAAELIAPVEPPQAPRATATVARPQSTLLDELVGREIAARLRGRFAEIAARVA